MNDVDFEILGLKSLLAASKRRAFRENVVARTRALINFLQSKKLTHQILLEHEQELCDDFQLMKSDLTSEGFELIRRGLSKWDQLVEAGHPIEDLSPLEMELAAIRNESGNFER